MPEDHTHTTLTTKDMYRKAVLDQVKLINLQKKEVFERELPHDIATGIMGVYWSIGALKNLLYIYIHDKIDEEGNLIAIEDYERVFNQIKLNFNHLLVDPDLTKIRVFIAELNKWQDLLTIYFSEAGLLPKKRVSASLITDDIKKVEGLEELQKAIIREIPEPYGTPALIYIENLIRGGNYAAHTANAERP